MTEDETVCSIKEALEVVREWNPDWSPHLFMTDNCSQEIQAIENLFPGKSELMAPQPHLNFKMQRYVSENNTPRIPKTSRSFFLAEDWKG